MAQLEQATALTEQSLAMFRSLHGENHLEVAENLVNLGVLRMQTDHLAQALPVFDEAIDIIGGCCPGIIRCTHRHWPTRRAHSLD